MSQLNFLCPWTQIYLKSHVLWPFYTLQIIIWIDQSEYGILMKSLSSYISPYYNWISHVYKPQKCFNHCFVYPSMHYNKYFNRPIRKQYFDDVIRIWKYFHWLLWVNKPTVRRLLWVREVVRLSPVSTNALVKIECLKFPWTRNSLLIRRRSDYIISQQRVQTNPRNSHGLLHRHTIYAVKFEGKKQHTRIHGLTTSYCLWSHVGLYCFSFKLCRVYCVLVR